VMLMVLVRTLSGVSWNEEPSALQKKLAK
jgi:hypothetical protein